jgi:hypothetical protein
LLLSTREQSNGEARDGDDDDDDDLALDRTPVASPQSPRPTRALTLPPDFTATVLSFPPSIPIGDVDASESKEDEALKLALAGVRAREGQGVGSRRRSGWRSRRRVRRGEKELSA